MRVINLTQHPATPEQISEGVIEPSEKEAVRRLLTFDEIPSKVDIEERAAALAEIASGYEAAMIGGAPYLMGALETALIKKGVSPLYSYTKRISVEKMEDGVVVKTNVFKHAGWVKMGN